MQRQIIPTYMYLGLQLLRNQHLNTAGVIIDPPCLVVRSLKHVDSNTATDISKGRQKD